MNMTDMLLQMTMQAAWQVPNVSQSNGSSQSSANSQGTSFQELLDQRRDQLTQQSGDKTNGTQKPEDNTAQEPADPTQPQPEEQPETMELQAAALAPFLMNQTVTITPVVQQGEVAPEAAVTTPVQTLTPVVETTVDGNAVQMPQVQADNGLTQQVQPQQAQVIGQAQEPQQTQQTNQSADALNGQNVSAQQTQETVVTTQQTAQQSQQDQAQDLTQSAPQNSQDQKLDDAAVSSWQTPLFQDVEATPVRVGDAEVDMTAPAQEVENKLGDMLKTALQQGEQRLEIKLTPANLGTVVAEFTRSPEGILHVVLHAENEQTARLLSDHASSLGMLLQENTNSQVRVEVPQPQQSQSMWQQPDDQQQQQHQQQQQQQQHTPRQEAETFLHQLRLGLVENQTEAV